MPDWSENYRPGLLVVAVFLRGSADLLDPHMTSDLTCSGSRPEPPGVHTTQSRIVPRTNIKRSQLTAWNDKYFMIYFSVSEGVLAACVLFETIFKSLSHWRKLIH